LDCFWTHPLHGNNGICGIIRLVAQLLEPVGVALLNGPHQFGREPCKQKGIDSSPSLAGIFNIEANLR
jgi:hypothetical protein